jgi:hypothetical protein
VWAKTTAHTSAHTCPLTLTVGKNKSFQSTTRLRSKVTTTLPHSHPSHYARVSSVSGILGGRFDAVLDVTRAIFGACRSRCRDRRRSRSRHRRRSRRGSIPGPDNPTCFAAGHPGVWALAAPPGRTGAVEAPPRPEATQGILGRKFGQQFQRPAKSLEIGPK